ncbi:hypothetical protein PoB_000781000 [Plakobranchus ocellatus]|uniref:Uncharacterized protein n=1 Tax=Plakobranchus ocellatus TaxID=259542 RepID=A0AAV3YE29_9GAST|nr:hypothetical protein PoB_000781000 [Plakobranchus ocellatus]
MLVPSRLNFEQSQQPPKDGRRSVPPPPKREKPQKDSLVFSSQRAAETETLVKLRAEKSKRQEGNRQSLCASGNEI